MKQLVLLLSLFSVFTQMSFAQGESTGLRGRVVDENQEPIIYSTLSLFNHADSTMAKAGYSNEDGTFEFTHLPAGDYYLVISYVGYDTYTSEVIQVKANQIQTLGIIAMSPFATELGEVVVASTKPVVEVKPDKTVFNVEGSINAIGNNALELLRKAPGVVVDNNENLMLIGKSGVKVYIDGKQTLLRGEDLANYLKTLESTQIEAIEIITQPSSRYEAEGNAGIINIRLIKDKSLGTNATISLGHNQAVHGRTNANINFNNRSKAMNIYGNISGAHGANYNWQHFERIIPGNFTSQDNRGLSDWNNGSLRAGVDIYAGANSTIGFLADGYLNDSKYSNNIRSELAPGENLTPTELLLGSSDVDNNRNNYNLNANYRFDNKKGTIINLDVDYGAFSSDGNSYQPNRYYDFATNDLLNTRIFSFNTITDIEIATFKLDYEKSLFGGTLGAGGKLALVNTDNDYKFYDIVDDQAELNIDLSNLFKYQENVNAAYVNFAKQWEKVGLQLGVRLEHTDSEGDLTSYKPQPDESVHQDYVNLFPSGGITYQLNPKHTLRVTYSRRIDRPNYQDLNPFEFKLDELTFQKGNPFLRPQFSNSIQLGHTFNYTLNTTLTYSRTNDLMAEITDTASMRAAFITTENIATQDVWSLNVSYPFALTKAWNVFANTSVTNTHNKADFGDGKTVDITATTFNIYMQHSYILAKGFTFEISGWYNSPGIWGGNFASGEMWSIDAGLQKKILQNRGNIKVSISDIFKSQEWSGENNFGGLAMRAMGGWESRQLRFNFTYLLGNKDVKSSRRRSTGLEEESRRIESGN